MGTIASVDTAADIAEQVQARVKLDTVAETAEQVQAREGPCCAPVHAVEQVEREERMSAGLRAEV